MLTEIIPFPLTGREQGRLVRMHARVDVSTYRAGIAIEAAKLVNTGRYPNLEMAIPVAQELVLGDPEGRA